MKKIILLMKESLYEFKKVRTLTLVSMLIGIAVVLGFYAVQVGDYIKISFAFIANELTGLLFGPVVGGIMGGVTDIIKYIARPTGPFFFGFTFNAILGGMIYGFLLYKRPVRLSRIIVAKVIVMIVINLGFTTLWLSMMFGQAFLVILPMRIIKESIMLPIETGLFYGFAKVVERIPGIREIRRCTNYNN